MAKESLCREATELNYAKFLTACKKHCELESVSLSNDAWEKVSRVYSYNCLMRLRYLFASSHKDSHDFYNGDLEYVLGLEYKGPECHDVDRDIIIEFLQNNLYLIRDGFFRDFNDELLYLLQAYELTSEDINALSARDLLKGLGPYYSAALRENFYAKKFNFFYEHCSDDEIHSFMSEHGIIGDSVEKIYLNMYDDFGGAEKLHREIHDFIFYYTDSANNTNG